MQTSARNQFLGTITAIQIGAVNSEVTLDIGNGVTLTAMVTQHSATQLGLTVGQSAYALIKAPSVILLTDPNIRTSARNELWGTVTACQEGAVNAVVTVTTEYGQAITAVVTCDSVHTLGLTVGKRACAIFKASHIILAVDR